MSASQIFLLALAGIAAGAINTVVGSGTLVTFPVLLAFGYPSVTANVSNTIGLVPGSLAGAWGYRGRLAGQRSNVVRLGAASVLGGLAGAVLLLSLPASTFDAIVPLFIAVALVLTLLQTKLRARLQRYSRPSRGSGVVTALAVFASGIYGGYFGAGQGILLLGILGVALPQDLQRTNALKNLLAGLVNGVASLYFVSTVHVEWAPSAVIAVTSMLGAHLGARYGKRLKPSTLRTIIVAVGVVAIINVVNG
jgi:uncharacterized membrane protein YfcA